MEKMMEGVIMNHRVYFEKLFADYPDLVSLQNLQEMLGGISQGKALKLVKQGEIKSFYVHSQYMIPKICIIDYLMGNIECAMRVESIHQNQGKRRKPGTGCLHQINDHLWEGKYSPRNTYGERISKNVYAKTRAECERKLFALIARMNKEIHIQKIKLMEEKYAEGYVDKYVTSLQPHGILRVCLV
ncbi:MAG: hypothetical protein E7467_07325 [Ruminococcaceae bacterium]|nr:hypothetical protein [Oscillospiraceae bacterium]